MGHYICISLQRMSKSIYSKTNVIFSTVNLLNFKKRREMQ